MDEKRILAAAPPLIVAAPEPLKISVLLADPSNYSRAKREVEFITVHCTHGAEGIGKAAAAAKLISKPFPPSEKKRSFGYAVDATSTFRCVPDLLTAWHAGRTANSRSIGVEICGSADQTRAEWLDKTSLATLSLAVRLVADLCREHKVPPVILNEAKLKARARGITTHAVVSATWHESTHWDPGPNFPLEDFVEAVRVAMGAKP